MNFPKIYNKLFDLASKKGTHINFIDLLRNINNKKNKEILTKHIYNEIPIRLANRVINLNDLPFGLSKNHSIHKVRSWYLTSFIEMINLKNEDLDSIKFHNSIETIYKRHSDTFLTMSKGIYELKMENKITDIEAPIMQKFLNKFYSNRTEIRILLEHFLSLNNNLPKKNSYGIINLKTNPLTILNNVLDQLQSICYEDLQNIIIINTKNHIELPFIDHYLHYILFELIKNSIQATREKNNINKIYNPFITININNLDENWIVIKIEDNGIGIKHDNLKKIWYYSFSTTPIDKNDINDNIDFSPILSGFGHGLPISDIYMNFFNSDNYNIKIESIYGKGTIVYLFLKKYNI